MDTDDDDPDYEPLSCVSPSPLPPPSSLSHPSSSSHPLSSSRVLPAVPSLIPVTMPPMLATDPAAPERAIPTYSAEQSEQSDGSPVNTDASDPVLPRYVTCSQNATSSSSSALSISVALDPAGAPIPRSVEEKDSEINRLRMTCSLLEQELADAGATIAAGNAHCTIVKRAESDARAELRNKMNEGRCTVETTPRYVTHDAMREMHASQTQEKARRAREAAQKEAQKAEEEAARDPRIRGDIETRVFTDPLSSYKRKHDLIVLAGALGLRLMGTVSELTATIKSHLSDNLNLQLDPRFAGLFLQNKRHRVDNGDSMTVHTTV